MRIASTTSPGPTYGTISVGGDLRATDLAGRREVLVATDPHGDSEVARDFRIVGDRLHYRIAHFDAGAPQPHLQRAHPHHPAAATP